MEGDGNMMCDNDQTAKADAGKLRLTLVPTEIIRAIATIEEYDQKAENLCAPQMIRKTQKVKGNWKAEFICPYCGETFEAYVSNVMRGKQRSCGCAKGRLAVESKGTHGESKTRLYRIYKHIQERCNSPKCKEYKWYGARGIECKFANYEEFRDYAKTHGYDDSLTVERIDVNGNYEPGNVAFIPFKYQARNLTKTASITYHGLTLCAAEWGEILGIRGDTITKRKRAGWSDERTIETPVKDSLDISLVPTEIIYAIRQIRLYGAKKYPDGGVENWRKVEVDRYRDAAFRHFLAYLDDPQGRDEESGLPHLWHLACNVAFLCEMEDSN